MRVRLRIGALTGLLALLASGCRPLPSSHHKMLGSGRSLEVIEEEFTDGPWSAYDLAYFTGVDPTNGELVRQEMRNIWKEVRPEVEARGFRRAGLSAWDRNWHKTYHRAGPRWDHGDTLLCVQLQRKADGSWEHVAQWSSNP